MTNKSIKELDEQIKETISAIAIAAKVYKENNNAEYVDWEIKTKLSILKILSDVMLDLSDVMLDIHNKASSK
jgi:hypothetical protein